MKKLTIIVLTLALTACATRGAGYQPVIDTQGKDEQQAAVDLAACQKFATQRADAATGAIIGGVAVALLGAFLAPRGFKNEVAGKAGVLGALGGANGANETQETIIKRCMAGRGYNVLN